MNEKAKAKKVIRKEKRQFVISTRLSESEYFDFLANVSGKGGMKKRAQSSYLRAAALGMSVRIIDSEVEAYRMFIAGKMSNNINQIAKRLNTDFKSNILTSETYHEVLIALKAVHDDYLNLIKPLE